MFVYVCVVLSRLMLRDQFVSDVLCDSFMAADISDVLKENIRKSNYDKPTPIQKWAIPVMLSGRDLMGCAQTGSGKTVSFNPYST